MMRMIRTTTRSVLTFMSTPGEFKTRIEKRFPTKPNIATIGIRVPCKMAFNSQFIYLVQNIYENTQVSVLDNTISTHVKTYNVRLILYIN